MICNIFPYRQKIKEREKEVVEFYKSETESEHEEEVSDTEIPSAEKTEDQPCGDSSKTESVIQENVPVENTEFSDGEKKIMNTENQEILPIGNIEISEDQRKLLNAENEDLDENLLDSNLKESVDKSLMQYVINKEYENIPSEMINLKETKNCQEFLNSKQCVESELNSQSVEDSPDGSKVSEISPATELAKDTEDSSEPRDKIILLSNVLVMPTTSNESNNLYNLDNETEVQKENEEQNDSYEFNLDDIDEEFDPMLENKTLVEKESEPINVSKRKAEILEKLGKVKPRLSVGPNQIIDLEKGVAMPDEIFQLRERFIKHNLKLEKHSHKKEIRLVNK